MSGISRLHVEDGQVFLRVSPGHSISADWLREHAADLYAAWRTAQDGPIRDQLAAQMEQRLEELEPAEPIAAPTRGNRPATQPADRVREQPSVADPHHALRAEILQAVTAAGHDPAQARDAVRRRGVRLAELAPSLLPISDFYTRHAPAIEARLDREIAAAGFRDLAGYLASWPAGRPASASLHDTEQAIVEHVIGDVLTELDGADSGRCRAAELMGQRGHDRGIAAGRAAEVDDAPTDCMAPADLDDEPDDATESEWEMEL